MSTQTILINVSGQDQAGLMSLLSGVLTEFDTRLLDIGQAVIHSDLALGVLVRVAVAQQADFVQAVQKTLADAGALHRITAVSRDEYLRWLAASGQPRFILTLLALGDGVAPLHSVSTQLFKYGLNIDTVRRLTDRGRVDDQDRKEQICIEMRLRGSADQLVALRDSLMGEAHRLDFDFSLQEDTVFRRNRRLVAFDMDSTLITQEVIDELAARHGVGEQVADITRRAMAGELDFEASFRERSRQLAGMPVSLLEEVANAVSLNSGARRLLRALHYFGYKTAVISGGFQYVGDHLQQQLGIDYVFANKLVSENGVMTGEVDGTIVTAARKAELLEQVCQQEGIGLGQAIAIGDGANDLPMLGKAGLGVAFHAKPLVRESARHAISRFGLDAILYLIGFSDRDIEQALSKEASSEGA